MSNPNGRLIACNNAGFQLSFNSYPHREMKKRV